MNRVMDLESHWKGSPCPKISGTFEIHIFFTPLNPSPEIVAKYTEITELINRARGDDPGFNRIKPVYLALDFRGVGYVKVMQSARYYVADSVDQALAECRREADLYQRLFDESHAKGELKERVHVVREKLETLASSPGVPTTDDEAQRHPQYFEFHLRVTRRGRATGTTAHTPVTDKELRELTTVSETFSRRFSVPVPISYNQNNEHQRYLNLRFRGIGSETARARVQEVVTAINETASFTHVKTISEYVPFDSYPELDRGWIDF